MDLDTRCAQIKELFLASPDFLSVDDIKDPSPHQRVIGVEPADGELFFLVIQEP